MRQTSRIVNAGQKSAHLWIPALAFGLSMLASQAISRAQQGRPPDSPSDGALSSGTEFEAVSVHENRTGAGETRVQFLPGGLLVAVNAPLSFLIATAYGDAGRPLPDSRMSGGSAWIRTSRFDVEARASGDPDRAAMLRLLANVLSERFGLVTHRASTQTQIYSLTLARGDRRLGKLLAPTSTDCSRTPSQAIPAAGAADASWGPRPFCAVNFRPGNVTGGAATLDQLANALSVVLRQNVRNDTDLDGRYDIDLSWTPEGIRPPGVDSSGPAIGDAIQDQLGLKLVNIKATVQLLIIDDATKPKEE